MPEARIDISRSFHEGPYVSVGDFVASGHLGGSWQLNEHSHSRIQVTILTRENSFQADWITDAGSKPQKRISGPAVCITPSNQPHAMEWDEAHGALIMMISPDLWHAESQPI